MKDPPPFDVVERFHFFDQAAPLFRRKQMQFFRSPAEDLRESEDRERAFFGLRSFGRLHTLPQFGAKFRKRAGVAEVLLRGGDKPKAVEYEPHREEFDEAFGR